MRFRNKGLSFKNFRSSIIKDIEHQVQMDKLSLDANSVLGNKTECMNIKHRIADNKIVLLLISGDLPA
jgi:hypothetical protein